MSEREKIVIPHEFAVNHDGVDEAMGIAARKLAEAKLADKAVETLDLNLPGTSARAELVDKAAHLRQEAELISTVLEMVVDIPNGGRNWMAMIQGDADHISSST